MKNVKTFDSPYLKMVCTDIDIENTSFEEIEYLFWKMRHELVKHKNGVAISANQIGEDVNMFVYNYQCEEPYFDPSFVAILNPEILERSDETVVSDEGCLSLPGLTKSVARNKWVRVNYWEFPSMVRVENRIIDGFMSTVFQHEYDHLRGIKLNELEDALRIMVT